MSLFDQCENEDQTKALQKGIDICNKYNTPEPVIFIHDSSCEFKWTDLILYTFGDDRETIVIAWRTDKYEHIPINDISDTFKNLVE